MPSSIRSLTMPGALALTALFFAGSETLRPVSAQPAAESAGLTTTLQTLDGDIRKAATLFLNQCSPTGADAEEGARLYGRVEDSLEAAVDSMRDIVSRSRQPKLPVAPKDRVGRAQALYLEFVAHAARVRAHNVTASPVNEFQARRIAENALKLKRDGRVPVADRGPRVKDNPVTHAFDADEAIQSMALDMDAELRAVGEAVLREWKGAAGDRGAARLRIVKALDDFELGPWPGAAAK